MEQTIETRSTTAGNVSRKKEVNRGAWTAEEDMRLAEVVAAYGAKKWEMIAAKAGLNRCGKSCRLRWMNYLRPNIKRGNISDQEEDLILRLHKLLGNRWSLIARRLPGRTDNEIKNYWNSHLSKKVSEQKNKQCVVPLSGKKNGAEIPDAEFGCGKESDVVGVERSEICFDVADFFDFSNEDPSKLEWISRFVEL